MTPLVFLAKSRYNRSMENNVRLQILRIIESAEFAYQEGLSNEKMLDLGYPYVAGYANSALRNIRELLEVTR